MSLYKPKLQISLTKNAAVNVFTLMHASWYASSQFSSNCVNQADSHNAVNEDKLNHKQGNVGQMRQERDIKSCASTQCVCQFSSMQKVTFESVRPGWNHVSESLPEQIYFVHLRECDYRCASSSMIIARLNQITKSDRTLMTEACWLRLLLRNLTITLVFLHMTHASDSVALTRFRNLP